ncbi:MAG: isoprenylcysteine carboxylmethyltransferase family protein [Ignavibacteriaceae bacterium]|nr:isoprenylcysteine carboxylmethyltransferase family protein [Ignavibacteriaceae bacterium]
MDPINIIIGINILALFGANLDGARRGLKSAVAEVKEKPKSWLQKNPPALAALILFAQILGVFSIGNLVAPEGSGALRYSGLAVYLIFSWFQIYALRSLGKFYSQDIVILKKHELVTTGAYRFIRHPHYLGQLIADIGCGLALFNIPVLLLVLPETVMLIMRAQKEEAMIKKHFPDQFAAYRKKSGFMIPFIG